MWSLGLGFWHNLNHSTLQGEGRGRASIALVSLMVVSELANPLSPTLTSPAVAIVQYGMGYRLHPTDWNTSLNS